MAKKATAKTTTTRKKKVVVKESNHKYKFQFLVPQYEETDEVVKPLLDSIAIQQNVNFDDISVIICNDGSDVRLSDTLLKSYPFNIEYHLCPHRGVSATRNACLDRADADYIMFCDADDMFFNAYGLFVLFTSAYVEKNDEGEVGFDALTSVFMEEVHRDGAIDYIPREMDFTFVHGKVYRLDYLKAAEIRWNDDLTIHEDSYFNCLALHCVSKPSKGRLLKLPIYLWKWRDASVCRHDPKYMLKTYNNWLDSSDALVEQFMRRGMFDKAQFFVCQSVYTAYYTMNKKEWIDQENKEYRYNTEKRFKNFYIKYKTLLDTSPEEMRNHVIVNVKNQMFNEGMFLEEITFTQWLNHLLQEID
ncbi:MAG: glycosyltransferase family 2 protein [Paludibacteraceae bacterium]|nr:glycosyltransferase family 2 protein [Paludibacteraceae bacterium]